MQKFKNAASKYEMYEVHEQILYLGEQIKHMIHHSQAQEEKESVHAMNLAKSQQIIRIYSILKVLAIGLGLGAQFYLLRKYMSLWLIYIYHHQSSYSIICCYSSSSSTFIVFLIFAYLGIILSSISGYYFTISTL